MVAEVFEYDPFDKVFFQHPCMKMSSYNEENNYRINIYFSTVDGIVLLVKKISFIFSHNI